MWGPGERKGSQMDMDVGTQTGRRERAQRELGRPAVLLYQQHMPGTPGGTLKTRQTVPLASCVYAVNGPRMLILAPLFR